MLWLWDGARFRGGIGARGAGGEYDVNGCVANGSKLEPLRGETFCLEVDIAREERAVVQAEISSSCFYSHLPNARKKRGSCPQ